MCTKHWSISKFLLDREYFFKVQSILFPIPYIALVLTLYFPQSPVVDTMVHLQCYLIFHFVHQVIFQDFQKHIVNLKEEKLKGQKTSLQDQQFEQLWHLVFDLCFLHLTDNNRAYGGSTKVGEFYERRPKTYTSASSLLKY